MRKLICAVAIAGVFIAGAAFAPQANAQTIDATTLRPFSPAANYMTGFFSKPGNGFLVKKPFLPLNQAARNRAVN